MANEDEIIQKIRKYKEENSPNFNKYMSFYKEKFPEFYESKLKFFEEKKNESGPLFSLSSVSSQETAVFKEGKVLGEIPIFNINNGKKEGNGENKEVVYSESVFKTETKPEKKGINKIILIVTFALIIIGAVVGAYFLLS